LIKKLNNKNKETAYVIQTLFRISYQIEAELLNAIDFPPLKRKLVDFVNCDTEFYGFWKDNEITAIVEVKFDKNNTDIHSLVVHPKYFRQGIGKQLILFVFKTFNSKTFTVETGLKNEPATKLYEQLGFKEVKQWNTESGIRKVKFIKAKHNSA